MSLLTRIEAALVICKVRFVGAVERMLDAVLNESVTPQAFGAIADGQFHPLSEKYGSLSDAQAVYPFVTSLNQSIDWAALQAAVNSQSSSNNNGRPGHLKMPPGDYIIQQPVVASSAIAITGSGVFVDGARFHAHSTFSGQALLILNGPSRVKDVTFVGKAGSDGVKVNSNGCCIQGASFINCQNHISFHESEPVFYFSCLDTLFYTSYESDIKVFNSSNGGVDMILSGNRHLHDKGLYCLNFSKGVGSIIGDNLQISITGVTPSQQLVYWGVPAPGFGGVQFSNCVFEGQGGNAASMFFAGTEAAPWKAMFFDTCFFTGQNNPAMLITYVDGLVCNACGFSSNTSNSVVYAAGTIQKNTKFIGCSYDGSGAQSPFRSLGDSAADVYISAPRWDGGASLVDFSLCSPNNVSMTVEASSKLATPVVKFPTGTSPNMRLVNDDPIMGYIMERTLMGTLTGNNMVVAHGVTELQKKLLSADAYYRGGSGELVKMTITTIDGGNITINGGLTGRTFVIYFRYAGKSFNLT